MNERIKELIRQADRYTVAKMADVGGNYFDFYNQKFAELLIQECALQCVHNEDMDLIEKHFGVTE